MEKMPSCNPFPIPRKAFADERDPSTFSVTKRDVEGRLAAAEKGDRNIAAQKARRGKAKEEQRKNAALRKMGKSTKTAKQIIEEHQRDMVEEADDGEQLDEEFKERPLIEDEEDDELLEPGTPTAPAAPVVFEEDEGNDLPKTAEPGAPTAPAVLTASDEVIQIRREHETRGQALALIAVFRDWETFDAQERIVDEWRQRRDDEYKQRLDEMFEAKAREKGVDTSSLGPVHEHPKFVEWLEKHTAPWKARWHSTMEELYDEATSWWKQHHRMKASRLPEGWKCPRPPKSADLAELFRIKYDSIAQRKAGDSAERLIQLRKQIPSPPKSRTGLVQWWLRLKWAESHPSEARSAKDKPVEFLYQWWENHNRAKAVVPPDDWVCPDVPPPEELLDGSKNEPEYEDAEEAADPPEWVNWIVENPCPEGAFFPELEDDPKAEDDTELLAWCAQRNLALAQCKWEQLEEPMPLRRHVLKEWLSLPEN